MVDDSIDTTPDSPQKAPARTRRRAASRPAGPPVKPTSAAETAETAVEAPVAAESTGDPESAGDLESAGTSAKKAAAKRPAKKAVAKKATKKSAAKDTPDDLTAQAPDSGTSEEPSSAGEARMATAPLFLTADDAEGQAPAKTRPARPSRAKKAAAPVVADSDELESGELESDVINAGAEPEELEAVVDAPDGVESVEAGDDSAEEGDDDEGRRRRRRRRGGRGRKRRSGDEADGAEADEGTGADVGTGAEVGSGADDDGETADEGDEGDDDESRGSRRRRRRRRRGSDGSEDSTNDDPPNTVTRVREPRGSRAADDVTSLKGSTRLEAKKQRRREGREAGRRRAPILTEAEFLARRESVDRVMVVRQRGERTQIAVLEDGVLVEHYVTRGSSSSMVGNVYLGRVQNVLPSMEAAFVDIGRGRNAVLYAGEVNWDAAGLDGQPKRIESALKSGDTVLVQVTKDPVGQKGARLTSQVSLPGRFLVYVPDGSMTGISRKLPDTERSRLKSILKRVMPEEAGVIVRTAAEGAPEEALEQDVTRLQAQWEDISAAAKSASPPTLLYGEPDLAIKVVRDLFNEDVKKLVVSGDSAWTSISAYIGAVAPDLVERLQHWVASDDLFAEYRVEEQLMKALDRKVYLPSGGSLVIDRTEAMTVVDVNTGKFTGQGGNLEQTVTRNNIEAAEEIVRQLRLRDIGGIIVVDFIDMVLESNRDLVLRRLVECLGRDRTKHQVAEVTSLGLVQMTRKRIGSGLIESFSQTCETCNGRGIRVSLHAEHDHAESPKARKPAGFVDPAEAAARALAQREDAAVEDAPAEDTPVEDAPVEEFSEDVVEVIEGVEEPAAEGSV